MTDAATSSLATERSLLIVEDDKAFLERLTRAMEERGFMVTTAESVSDGMRQVETAAPAFAVVDMRLGDGNGLDVVSAIKKRRPEVRAIILTGYGNIATAVNAVKLGAVGLGFLADSVIDPRVEEPADMGDDMPIAPYHRHASRHMQAVWGQ